jgi:hypothetical protein
MNKENITTILIKKEGDKIHFEYQNCNLLSSYALTMTHLIEIIETLSFKNRNNLIDETIKKLNEIRGN